MSTKRPPKKSDAEENSLIQELKDLLREGRNVFRDDSEKAKELFRKGQELALNNGWKEDAAVFKAFLLLAEGKYKEVKELLTPLLEKKTLHLKGYIYEIIGITQTILGFHDQAIDYFQKALKDTNYDAHGDTWNNIGLAYAWKGNYDKAIECFQKAINTPNYNTPDYAWNNMGLAYTKKGNYDKAIECHREALKDPNYDTQGDVWYNMGVAYYEKGDLNEALKCLKKARAWYEENEPKTVERVDSRINSIKHEMQLRKSGLNEAAEDLSGITKLSSGLNEAAENLSGITKLRPKELDDPIERIQKILGENRNRIEDYAKKPATRYKDVLVILKGWSSSMPIVASVDHERFNNQICHGGGYFIKTDNQGIVIDPGLDFVTNFGNEGEIEGSSVTKGEDDKKTLHRRFHIKEVTQVITTHHHIDHFIDISRINDLNHQWRTYLEKEDKPEPIHYYFDKTTNKHHSLTKVSEDNTHELDHSQPERPLQGNVKIYPFSTKHNCESSFGFRMEVKLSDNTIKQIGYTSDMSLLDENLPTQLTKKELDAMIAHFSFAEPEDFREGKEHKNHLGFTGLKKLISGTNARLYIISEFWGGKCDYRVEVVQKLLYDLKKDGTRTKIPAIIPGDVGCMIDLRELKIRCSTCGEFVPCEELSVIKPELPFGKLRYLCKNCLL